LRKNDKTLGREARRAGVGCFRLYDADMPEYAFAIDSYRLADSDERHLYVQEYAPPATIEPAAAARRRAEVLAVLPEASGVAIERIHLRTRQRQSGASQYERQGDAGRFHVVEESGLRFRVNFDDYLDTGLFLDHRITRQRLRAAAADVRFLNLFCYTASASVYAAAGGAARSTSVDMSNTYLDWAAENFRLNGMDPARHRLLRADCRDWLRAAAQETERFELIFLDPPTFSNSRRMEGTFDVLRDHAALIDDTLRLLAPGGLLVFSTNAQQFRIDAALAARCAVQDISAATLPFDFRRNARIHRCFEVRRT
jgi:23S rRNA (guanine2445-N2)-methyltransferase / 23S rRNA (guanine2069-N7)-methyltransferase